MNDADKLGWLQLRLSSELGSLTPHYLLRWLEFLPPEYSFGDVQDVVLSFVGLSESISDMLETDGLSLIRSYCCHDPEWYAAVDDGDLVIRRWSTDEELSRAEIPEWLLQLGSLIKFLSDIWDRPLTAAELRDFFVQLWHPVFC